MPEYRRLNVGPAVMIIWRIEETEEQLKSIIGGDSFPALRHFKDPQRRLEWLATRCALKSLGVNDPIMYAPNRRPSLAKGKQHMSISHSRMYAVVILSTDFYLGIDIEHLGRLYKQTADRFLTAGEKMWVDFSNNSQLAIVWSAKEAMYKLPGMVGLHPFSDMEVMPFTRVGDSGHLQMKVQLVGRIHTFHFSYLFMDSHVITWVACNPQQMAW